jgi:FKBP12-rapamycin complex-associated protein
LPTPDPDIRLSVLSSLDRRFDAYLCQAENVRSICKALNDEVFEMRELAVAIVGRLTSLNPAYSMPPLRKTLIQLLVCCARCLLSEPKFQRSLFLPPFLGLRLSIVQYACRAL